MTKTVINLNAEEIDLASIGKTRNCYHVGEWSLRYNESKNSASFAFDTVTPRALSVTISDSTGWVRFMRPIDCTGKSGIYSVLLTLRALTLDPASKYQPYIFASHKPGNFEKHSKLDPCEGGFKAKICIQENSPQFWIGFETVEKDIVLLIDHIRLVLAESSNELTKAPDPHKTVALPLVTADRKSNVYSSIDEWNKNYESRANSDELSFLLDYAEGMRRVQMLETFIKMIRYLVVKYAELNKQQRDLLAGEVRNALKISRDEVLVDLIYTHCPALLCSLDLNEDILLDLAGLERDESAVQHHSLSKNVYFSLQGEPSKLFTLIHRELQNNKDYLVSNPSAYCALANAYVAKGRDSKRYLIYLNQFFDYYNLPMLEDIVLESGQCMSSMKFNKSGFKPIKGPLVSIIMSAYQAEKTIGYAIESLLNQTYENIEILVCDDCSEDNTLQVAVKYAAQDERVKVFQSNENQGTYNIRNDLISQSTGEYITFQDSDDCSHLCRIEEQMNVLVNEHKTVCFSEWLRFRTDGSVVYFIDGNVSRFCVVSAMAHRSVFERMPPFRPALVAADTEFHEQCKCLFGEEEIVTVRKPLILGLWGDESLTKRENLNADHTGFVAYRRRAYAEIAARQRIVGDLLITNNDVTEALQELEIYRKPQGTVAVSNAKVNDCQGVEISSESKPEVSGPVGDISTVAENVLVDNSYKPRVA